MHPYQKKTLRKTLIVVGIIVVLAAIFIGGIAYQKYVNDKSNPTNTSFGGGSRGGFGQGLNGQTPVFGTVQSISGSNIMVQNQQGNTVTVIVNSSTQYRQNRQSAQLSAIQNGDRIVAIGKQNSDGSITATRISINPSFGGGSGASGSSNSSGSAQSD